MKPPHLLIALLLTVAANAAQASELTAYQQAALSKILSTMPAEQRAMARPMLEKSLAGLSKEHVAMMLAGMAANAETPAPESSGDNQPEAGEWGAAEAEFDKAFAQAKGYIARISDVRDTAGSADLCRTELNLVPIGRRKAAAMADILAEQDRLQLRLMVEHRARYGTLAAFARQLGQPVSSPLVQAVKYYFDAPMSEGEVKVKLQEIQAEAARLADAHEKERLRIANGDYPDRGSGVFSKIEERAQQELQARTDKATKRLCEPALGYYQRGLVALIAPVVPKVKPYVQ